MTVFHYIGALTVLAVIVVTGILSGRKVKSAEDFDGGRNGTAGLITGAIIGTLVGGSSTIGTAQLAYSYGFSAWWFTLGGGIGVLVMLLFYAKPLYNSGVTTMPELFAREYGKTSATLAAILNSCGAFLSIVAQMLSGVALITAISPLANWEATLITIGVMLGYVFFGGNLGAGLVGIVKTIFMYLAVGLCGIVAIRLGGGVIAFWNDPALPHHQFFSLIARGAAVDLGAGTSLLLGVLTTQIYISSILTARSLRTAMKGALLAAVLIPLIGVAGIFVGMYMRLNYPNIDAKMALPLFIIEKMPPLAGGAMLGTLLITLAGAGAGIALGVASVFCRDIYKVHFDRDASPEKSMWVTRIIILLILTICAGISMLGLGDLILGWSFMSMGLRGAVAFVPLCTALFLPGRIPPKYIAASMVAGPLFVFAGKLILPPSVDALFPGIAMAFLICAVGYFTRRRSNR